MATKVEAIPVVTPASTHTSFPAPYVRAPPNFSWCEGKSLCACAFPAEREHIQYLSENGVTCLISLTQERQVDAHKIDDSELQIVEIPVRDYTRPTVHQVLQFLHCVEEVKAKEQAACVHCLHGLGRTGTMLACYFIKAHKMEADEAIAHVRKLRPGSIETIEQEMFVFEFYTYWQTNNSSVVTERESLI